MLKPEHLNQVLSSVLHPVGDLADMLVPLIIRPISTVENEKGSHWKQEQVYRAPKNCCRTAFCSMAAVGRKPFVRNTVTISNYMHIFNFLFNILLSPFLTSVLLLFSTEDMSRNDT